MLEYDIGQGYSALDAQAWRDRLDGFAVASGLGVSVSSGLTLSVASGTATVGETSGSVDTVTLGSSDTVTLDTADSTNPRKDVVYIDTNGDVQKEAGVAEPADPSGSVRFDTFQPEPPFPSTDGVILAEVWVPAGASSLTSSDVRDRRVPGDVVADRVVTQSVSTDTATINSKTGIGVGSSSSLNYTFGDGWVSVSRPTLVETQIDVETDGSTAGQVQLEVDEDGGTNPDYIPTIAYADPALGSGVINSEASMFLVPPGAQYQIVNSSDPNNSNNISGQSREFTL